MRGLDVEMGDFMPSPERHPSHNHQIHHLNQSTKDWHSRSVTLSPSASLRINSAKGLAVRFFAALRMTLLNGCVAKCTNAVHFDLEWRLSGILTLRPHFISQPMGML